MVKHRKVSAVADGPDAAKVQPSNWNDQHTFDLPVSLGGYVVLTNVGAAYDTTAPARGLGFVEMVMDGVDTLVFTVQVNKVGTGTQSWQLWNDTNSAEVAVITDAAAAGNKTLTTTVTGLALTGTKRLRVRAKSTVAADDPVYYGTSLLLRKTT